MTILLIPYHPSIIKIKNLIALLVKNWFQFIGSYSGGKKILMFCGRIDRDDIEVRFEFLINGKLWKSVYSIFL